MATSASADRFSPLIDGEEYFAAVRSSMIKAERQILVVGWELHSEVALLRGEGAEEATAEDGYPVVLADLLQDLVREREELQIHLLIWTGVALLALEREYLPRMKRPWERHPRIRLEWAEDTPALGSHHQKFVVVDDRVVFVGGMDLTKSRWDTHEHRLDDQERRKPGILSLPADPYHDTMAVYDGEVARVLGDLGRERWEQATSRRLERPDRTDGAAPWPDGVEPLLVDRRVALAVTQPEHAGRTQKREVEASFIAQFRAAERFIYIETQYLTASVVSEELARRLREPDGPEIVIVLPYGCPKVLECMALDPQRDRLIQQLRESDPGGRLGIYWPTLAGGSDARPFKTSVYVHAKVLVIDDRLLRIGSANMNNRSMGLDTELDAWIESESDERQVHESIGRFRRRSLAYLLGVDPGVLAEAERERGSLVAAIEQLRGGERSLHPFDHTAPGYARASRLDSRLADPDRPLHKLTIADFTGLRQYADRVKTRVVGLRRRKGAALAAVVIALVALVPFTPLPAWVSSLDVEALMRSARESPFGIVGMCALIAVLGSIGVPIVLLVASAGAIVASWWAAPVSLVGVTAASIVGFGFGRLAPDKLTRPFDSGRLGQLLERSRIDGVLAVAIIRNVPIAPFAVVNAALGLTGIGWAPYLFGTFLGLLPGVVLLSLFGKGLMALVVDPSLANIARLAGIAIGIGAIAIGTQKVLKRLAPRARPEREQSA